MSDDLIIYPIPSLVATLLNREKTKGSPLTEEEVIQIRDTAPSVAMTRDQAAKVDESRGYLDIDPENCWAEWQRARVELTKAKKRVRLTNPTLKAGSIAPNPRAAGGR